MFIRLLIIIVMICLILILGVKINEKFTNQFAGFKNLPAIKLSVESNQREDKLILKWNPVSVSEMVNYYIIMYINNLGPYIITLPHLRTPNTLTERVLSYEYNDLKMNVEYKFAVFAKLDGNSGITKVDKYVLVKKTPPGLEIEYINDTTRKILCKPDYGYDVVNSNGCVSDPDVIQAKTANNKGTLCNFNYGNHARLMREMNYNPKIALNFT